jgi:hypothetical protein
MVEPPFAVGAVQLTVAEALPAVAVTPVGAPGTMLDVDATDVVDALPALVLKARILTLYEVFTASPEIKIGEVVPAASAQLVPPSVEYWYLVMVEPVLVPAVKATDSEVEVGVMPEIVGAPGWLSDVCMTDVEEAVPGSELYALICTLYEVL